MKRRNQADARRHTLEHDHGHAPDHGHGHDHAHDHHGSDGGHDDGHDHGHGPNDGHSHAPGKSCGHDHDHDHEHHHAGCAHHHHDHDEDEARDAEATRRFMLLAEMLLLLMIAGVAAWFFASSRIDKLLNGYLRWVALAGGLGMFVLGVFNWSMRVRNAGCGHDHLDHDHEDDGAPGDGKANEAGDADGPGAHAYHSHESTTGGRALTLVLLSGSVAAAAALTPDNFSKEFLAQKEGAQRAPASAPAMVPKQAVTDQGGVTLALIEKYKPRNAEGNFEFGLIELYNSAWDPAYARVLTGVGVETDGQLVKDTINPGAGRYRLFVLEMSCCAADARPVSIALDFGNSPPADVQEMGWDRATGTLDYVQERGQTSVIVRATGLKPALRPRDRRTLFQ